MSLAVLSVNCIFSYMCILSFCLKIEVGSTNVRVGSVIFGNREYPNSAANTPNPSPAPSPAHSPGPSPAPSPEKTSKVVSEEAAKKMQHLTVS